MNKRGISESFSAAVNKCTEIEEQFSVFSSSRKADGALSRLQKELICIGIAVVKGCIWCVRRHTTAAADLGASYEQIMEAAAMAVVMDGGPGLARVRQLVLKSIEEYEEGYRAERVGAEWELVKVYPSNAGTPLRKERVEEIEE